MTNHKQPAAADPRLGRMVLQQLESLERAGVSVIPRPRARPASAAAPSPGATESPTPQLSPPRTPAPPAALEQPAAPPTDRLAALNVIRQQVTQCTRCRELAATRTQTVFGVGNPHARLCFVGEAPGADEDAQGEPFVGRAGQLLTKIIEACTLKREDVYILNVLKCRPPGNRRPEPDEVAHCRGFLDSQLDIIRPEYICCLGATAAQTLLETTETIGRLRGKFHQYRGIPVLCTYHPSYLLRDPSKKRDTWEDMQVLMARMGIELR